jgi:UPF0716 protein FxsA
MRANERLASGQIPAEEVVEGLMLAVGGALLLTPGFFTDAIGFGCLIPQTRHFFAKKLIAKGILKGANISGLGNAGQHGGFYQQSGFDFDRGPKHHQSSADDIEGESSPVNDDQLLK